MLSKTVTWRPRPESGLCYLICAILQDEGEAQEEGNNLSMEELSAFMADERPGEGDADDILVRMR